MPEPIPTAEPNAFLARSMETYGRAWETRDAALVSEVFTEDATYQQDPFGAPMLGRAGIHRYWEEATRFHREIRFRWQQVSSTGNLHVVEWGAEFTREDSGRRIELRGVMFIELRGERISRFREYWLRRENA